jgi:hypothetical protein
MKHERFFFFDGDVCRLPLRQLLTHTRFQTSCTVVPLDNTTQKILTIFGL